MPHAAILILILLISLTVDAQKVDTTIIKSQTTTPNPVLNTPEKVNKFISIADPDAPRKAAYYSAVLPGLGQIYNKKYWKIPMIYTGFMFFGYFINRNHEHYQAFKESLFLSTNNEQNEIAEEFGGVEGVRANTDLTRRNRDYTIILAFLLYAMNIIDAHVDAHLTEFDINDDLSFSISPYLQPSPLNIYHTGFVLSINMGKEN